MKFEMPDACSLCLGAPDDSWPVRSANKAKESTVESNATGPASGSELTRLNLSGNEGELLAPVCNLCRKRLKANRRICATIGLVIIVCGGITWYAIESHIGFGVFWFIWALLAANKRSWANRPILGKFRLVPGEFREWDIVDAEARKMGCRVLKGRLLVLTVNGIVDGDRIPVFTNPEYQRRFNVLNGIEAAYGIPQRSVEDSIYGFTLNQVRK